MAAEVAPEVAGSAEVHQTHVDASGQLGMRRVDAVELPAGVAIEFRPGGNHIMLDHLAHPLRTGTTLQITLRFARSHPQVIAVPVRPE